MKQTNFAIIIAVALFCRVDLATARIGETIEQCIARYGEPIKQLPTGEVAFKKAGLGIAVTFFNGKADTILFRKLEENAVGTPLELSDDEIAVLLKSNGGEMAWKSVNGPALGRYWQTEDSAITAAWMVMDHILFVSTHEAAQRASERRKKSEQKNLDGF